jgi:hypothetical protein
MATRRRGTTIDDLDIFEGGLTPAQMIMQSELAQTPSAFSYADLDKKYPTRQVTPMVPTYIQQRMDEDLIERKEQLAAQKAREAQASIYESQLNERILAAEQVPLARAAFSQLNPQDPNYPQKRDEILMNYPYAENDVSFMRSIVGRNDRTYDNYSKKNIATSMTLDDYGKAVKEIVDMERAAEELGEELSPAQKKYRGLRISQMKQFESRQGVGEPVSPTQPPALAPITGGQGNLSVKEGRIYRQGGKNYRYTNGQMVELP